MAGLFRRLLSSWQEARARRRAERGDPVRLTEEAVEYWSPTARTRLIPWSQIGRVCWSEPDYGYFEGLPYWTVVGAGTSIDIEDLSMKGDDGMAVWLTRKVPGFDCTVVQEAWRNGYFKANKSGWMVCWPTPSLDLSREQRPLG